MSKNFIDYESATSIFQEYANRINDAQIQVSEMPVYTSVPLGTIVQYVGATSGSYTNGYFYIRKENGWAQKNVQSGGGGGESGVIPVDPEDTSDINIWIETT